MRKYFPSLFLASLYVYVFNELFLRCHPTIILRSFQWLNKEKNEREGERGKNNDESHFSAWLRKEKRTYFITRARLRGWIVREREKTENVLCILCYEREWNRKLSTRSTFFPGDLLSSMKFPSLKASTKSSTRGRHFSINFFSSFSLRSAIKKRDKFQTVSWGKQKQNTRIVLLEKFKRNRFPRTSLIIIIRRSKISPAGDAASAWNSSHNFYFSI